MKDKLTQEKVLTMLKLLQNEMIFVVQKEDFDHCDAEQMIAIAEQYVSFAKFSGMPGTGFLSLRRQSISPSEE